MADLMNQFMGPETMLGKALSAPSMVLTDTEDAWNRPDLWSAELPAANGITNARSLPRFYAGLSGTVEGGPAEPLLDADQVAAPCPLHTRGPDPVLMLMENT